MNDLSLPMKIASAAKEAGVPVRSLFRAVKAQRLPSTRENGVTMVMLADVRKWDATRNASADHDADPDTVGAPMDAIASGSDCDIGSGIAAESRPVAAPLVGAKQALTPPAAEPSGGETAGTPPAEPTVRTPPGFSARAFALFDVGVPPHKVVEQLEAEPDVVTAAFKHYREMLDLAGTVPSTLIGELLGREDTFENVAIDAAAKAQAAQVAVQALRQEIAGLCAKVTELESGVANTWNAVLRSYRR